jgi:hypothetical protein
MRSPRTARRFIWVALALQLLGFAYDALWHGVLRRSVEPQNRHDMVVHLLTVHLPLYVGVLSVFVTTAWAFIEAVRSARAGAGWWVALGGAGLSLIGEAWHAASHLQLDTHSAPIAGSLSLLGLTLVAGAVWRAGRESVRRGADRDQRRAA